MLLDFVVPVAPNQYAFVPNCESKRKRILYTTSLASCFGLIILSPGRFLLMSHVVSAQGCSKAYYANLLAELGQMNGGLDGLAIMFHGGQATLSYATTAKAVDMVKKLLPGASFQNTRCPSDTLLVNSLTGYVLNTHPHGGPETTELTKQLKEIVGKVSRGSYWLSACKNVHDELSSDPLPIADSLTDRTAPTDKSASRSFEALVGLI